MKYLVNWDSGHAPRVLPEECFGTFEEVFDTWDKAQLFAERWVERMTEDRAEKIEHKEAEADDFGEVSFEVIEVEEVG